MEIKKFNKDDLLKSFNTAIESSTKKLSMLTQKNISIKSLSTSIISPTDLYGQLHPENGIFTVTAMRVVQDVPGAFLLALDVNSVANLISLMLKQYAISYDKDNLELNRSTVKEAANIIFGAFLNELSHLTGKVLTASIPDMATDMIQATTDEFIAEISQQSEEAIVLVTKFDFDGIDLNGYLMVVLDHNFFLK